MACSCERLGTSQITPAALPAALLQDLKASRAMRRARMCGAGGAGGRMCPDEALVHVGQFGSGLALMKRMPAGWEAHEAHRTLEDLQRHLQRQLKERQLEYKIPKKLTATPEGGDRLARGGNQLAKTGTARAENDLGLPVLDWACAKTSSAVGVGLCQDKCRGAIVYDTARFPDGPPLDVLAGGSDDDFRCQIGTAPNIPSLGRDYCASCLTCEQVRGWRTRI